MPAESLPADRLRTPCSADELDFETTADLEPMSGLVGQERAVEAMELGLSVRRPGYNLFVLGPPGTGRRSAVRDQLSRRAAEESVPDDWCYVHNFDEPRHPIALRLPPGCGRRLRGDMEGLIDELRQAIPSIFESDAYRTRRKAIEEEIRKRQDAKLEEIAEKARERGIALMRTPMGFGLAVLRDGEVLDPGEVQKLPDDERKRLQREMEEVNRQVHEVLEKVPEWQREGRERIRELDRAAIKSTVTKLVGELRRRYEQLESVSAFLNKVEEDVLENASEFLESGEQQGPAAELGSRMRQEALRRYRVNVLVDRSQAQGAPVIHEEHPRLSNLIGRIEHRAQFGTLSTDFNLVEGGALHRANGGYLVLDARELLMQPFAWSQLKRVLHSGELRIESPMETLGMPSTMTLEPEPIPFDGKVVLVGERFIYYLLCELEPEFANLFKIGADFDEFIRRDADSTRLYARLLATLAHRQEMHPFDREAVAALIEHAARLAEDASKLSMSLRTLFEVMVEADHHGQGEGREVVKAADVHAAIEARRRRSGRLHERSLEALRDEVLRIETRGERVGTVNGLSVLQFADVCFARPSRITARVGMGKGELVDIEREVALGGPLHSKGVLILHGYLLGQYAPASPLMLRVSLVFEQSYGGVEGDSASLAELCALLSALAEVPVRQGLAMTGSVDQYGRVQAVGGVNDKIEGFFEACAQRELTGEQGVLVPASNVRHLMLRPDVVAAVREGRFHIYPVATVDEAVETMTGKSAGERRDDGSFPEGTVHGLAAARLAAWVESAKGLSRRDS